jgi:hypothetical protein
MLRSTRKLQKLVEEWFGAGAARWSRSTRHRRRARLRVASPPTTRTCSSTASTSRPGRRSTTTPTSRCSTARCAAPTRPARPTSRSWRWRRSRPARARRDQTISDPGYFLLGGHRFRDSKPTGHGIVDLKKSHRVVGHLLLHAAYEMGVDKIHDFMKPAGLRPADRHRHPNETPASCRPGLEDLKRLQAEVAAGRDAVDRHRPGLQQLHDAAARAGDRDPGQRRRPRQRTPRSRWP